MQAPSPYLENLSISELESLLAEKRRSEGKRVLRSIAGRTPSDAAIPAGTLRAAGLAVPERSEPKGKATRRLSLEEARALAAHPTLPSRRTTAAAAPRDRFCRPMLVPVPHNRRERGPAWLHQSDMHRRVDRMLQWTEIAFCALLFYVFAQWVYTEFQTQDNVAADMAPMHTVTRPVVGGNDRATLGDRPLGSGARSVVPSATATVPAPTAPAGLTDAFATLAATATLPAAGSTRDDVIQERLGRPNVPDSLDTLPDPIPAAPATISHGATTISDSMAGAAGTTLDSGSAAPTMIPGAAVESDPSRPTEIRIPRIKLDARVREVTVRLDTWEWEVADYMAGHHTGTANPGDTGNVVIAGHRDIRGSVFMNLDKLKVGDDIFVYSGRGVFHYVVRKSFIIKPSQIEVMAPTTDQRLTLITCTPVRLATHRLIVIADLDPNYVAPDRPQP